MTIKEQITSFMKANHMDSWHEPDEHGVGATVTGDHLDNAFGAWASSRNHEFVIHLTVEGHNRLSINLADLLEAIAEC